MIKIDTSALNVLKRLSYHMGKLEIVDFVKLQKVESAKIIRKMKADAPIDTGRLRRGITATPGKNQVVFDSKAINKFGQDYAPEQEFGGRFNPAHPYFYHNLRKFNKNFRTALAGKVNKIYKGL